MWEGEFVPREQNRAELHSRLPSAHVVWNHDLAHNPDRRVFPLRREGSHSPLEGVREGRAQGGTRLHEFGRAGERNRLALVPVVRTRLDHHMLGSHAVLIATELRRTAETPANVRRRENGLRASPRPAAKVGGGVGGVGEHGADAIERDECRRQFGAVEGQL